MVPFVILPTVGEVKASVRLTPVGRARVSIIVTLEAGADPKPASVAISLPISKVQEVLACAAAPRHEVSGDLDRDHVMANKLTLQPTLPWAVRWGTPEVTASTTPDALQLVLPVLDPKGTRDERVPLWLELDWSWAIAGFAAAVLFLAPKGNLRILGPMVALGTLGEVPD